MESPLQPLVEQLSKLPGIGAKSAQRLAFFILSLPKKEVDVFADVMVHTRLNIKYCSECFNISLDSVCHICKDDQRDPSLLCIVSEPKDIIALERTSSYKGRYHVLGGLLSPIDGIHPETLRIPELVKRIRENSVKEVILAINPTIEGDATILYLAKILGDQVEVSKLASGLPMGADLDYADELTLLHALNGRTAV